MQPQDTKTSEKTTAELDITLKLLDDDLKQQNPKQDEGLAGLVIDLRQNPGGLLDTCLAVTNYFLKEGAIVTLKRRNTQDKVHAAEPEKCKRGDLPLAIILDKSSASASEVFAGALQDHRRALIMGERSFGKGSVQSLLPLGKDAALKLTTARYYTPSGKSVQEGGIKPDIAVPQISDPDYLLRMKYQTRESDLRGHLINELGIKDEAMEADTIADPRFQLTAAQLEAQGIKDFQLNYAMDTLRRTTRSTVALRPVTVTRGSSKK